MIDFVKRYFGYSDLSSMINPIQDGGKVISTNIEISLQKFLT